MKTGQAVVLGKMGKQNIKMSLFISIVTEQCSHLAGIGLGYFTPGNFTTTTTVPWVK